MLAAKGMQFMLSQFCAFADAIVLVKRQFNFSPKARLCPPPGLGPCVLRRHHSFLALYSWNPLILQEKLTFQVGLQEYLL